MKGLQKVMNHLFLVILLVASLATPLGALAEDVASGEASPETSLVSEEPATQPSQDTTSVDTSLTDATEPSPSDTRTSKPEEEASGLQPQTTDEASPEPEREEASVTDRSSVAVSDAEDRAAGGQAVNDVLTGVSVSSIDGTDLATTALIQWQTFEISAGFSLPNGQVQAGDYTLIQLPTSLAPTSSDFNVLDDKGNLVATAHIDGSQKTIRLTYTDYVTDHYDITGSLHFYARIDHTVIPGAQAVPLTLTVNHKTYYAGQVTFAGVGPVGYLAARPISKASWVEGQDPQVVQYYLAINRSGQDLPQTVISDAIDASTGQYLPQSFTIEKGTWVWQSANAVWALMSRTDVTANYPVQFGEGQHAFSLNLGDLSSTDGFWIGYQVRLTDRPNNGQFFINTASLSSQGNPIDQVTNTTYTQLAGGQAQGYIYHIAIKKVSPDGRPLANAVFRLTRNRDKELIGVYRTTTDGLIAVSGLEKADYSLTEISAPEGYTANTSTLNISASDFSSVDQTARLTVVNSPTLPPNRPEAPQVLTISGRKTWQDANNQDGLRPSAITLRLLADGQEVAIRQVTAQDDWRYLFTDLPQMRDGKRIDYSLVEDPVVGYTSQVADYQVTNSHLTQVMSLRVTKLWRDASDKDGLRPRQVTMHLYANGQLWRTFTISRQAGDSWVYDLTDLPKYANGQLIRYQLTEDPVAGYEASYDGLTVTNSHQPRERLPQTGDGQNLGALFVGVSLIYLGMGLVEVEERQEL
ncbi:Cna B-type domain-containing protein [Streptococcus sp. DD12]|uniref:Cna B-type domain-containing protein n=1 Tax=Streptococcus sp. DD12 TaxID=1777880 RepID=UPI0007986768|nr:Cna B-type domain-containing protein [Streptococcus sp. DD12]KXT75682.1 hypothetical protein STRDD12_00794 [Streptococcus sp. DD12]